MRRLFTAIAATGFLAATAGGAAAQGRLLTSDDLYPWKGWYVSAFGGVHLKGSESGNSAIGPFSTTSRNSFNTGFQAGAAIGYSWQFGATPWAMRVEFEYSYSGNSADKFSALGLTANVNGSLQNHSFMNNVYLDYHLRKWVPYVGIGAGVALTRLRTSAKGPFPVEIKDSDTNFALQAMAGIDYKILPRWRIGVGYKYQAVFGTDYDVVVSGTNTSVGRTKLGTIDSHTILIKMGYLF